MVRKLTIYTILFLLSYFTIHVLDFEIVLANEHAERSYYSLSDFEVIEDVDGSYSFAEISSAEYSNQYRFYSGKTLSLGITNSVYWVRFKVLASSTEELVAGQLLQLNNPNLDKINIYIPVFKKDLIAQQQYIVQEVGVSRPSANRNIIDNTWVFQMPNELNDKDFIYLRLESTSALRLPVRIWRADDFIGEMFLKNLGFGAFYGILLAMFVFNLFIFSVLRDKTYLFYVLYIGSMFLYQFQVHGHLKMLIDIPYRLYNAVFWIWLAATFVFSIYFTRQFLQVGTNFPKFNKVLTGIVVIAVFQGILGVLGHNFWANQIAHGLGIVGPIFFIIIAVKRFHEGFRPARYYIIAWGVLSVGIVMWSLAAYLPTIFTAVNYLLAATASESILLSLALADRVKSLRIEGEVLSKSVTWYRKLSFTDGLSGLYNKRFFDLKIEEEITANLRCGTPMSLLVIDVDQFKAYNDNYGHWEGDQVIIRLGKLLLDVAEEGAMAFRYGGEEFILLLPNIRSDDATLIAEKLRQRFMKEKFSPALKSLVTVTISIGVTGMRADDNPESIFQRADEALYHAKKNGRNKTVSL